MIERFARKKSTIQILRRGNCPAPDSFGKALIFSRETAIISNTSRAFPRPLYTEVYRSGHNGPDSKSGSPHGLVGSNPTASAIVVASPCGLPRFVVHRKLLALQMVFGVQIACPPLLVGMLKVDLSLQKTSMQIEICLDLRHTWLLG